MHISRLVAILVLGCPADLPRDMVVVQVSTREQLQAAISGAEPGTTISIKPGQYLGGITISNLRGLPGRPIILKAADPAHPPVINGGAAGLHLTRVAHLELHDLVVQKSTSNGINIDDGGELDAPSHHLLLRNLSIRDVGPDGNKDGIKLSGLDDSRVEKCKVERWGNGGSGIDLVGCHRLEIVDCLFRHEVRKGDSGVQAKGGSQKVSIRRCRFENAGQRALNLGGSTGLAFFRPKPEGFEAKELLVEDCTIIGSMAPIAFVGVDGATVRRNTIYRPARWAIRVLQENREPGFVPSRKGSFRENLVVFRSDEMVLPVNVGAGTEIESFVFSRNAWYCLDSPGRSRPRLPVSETDGIYGIDPEFRVPDQGDLLMKPTSPLQSFGARQDPAVRTP